MNQQLAFPNVVQLVLSKRIKLYLDGCKVIKTLAGKLCLVNLSYGAGYYGSFDQAGNFRPTDQCTDRHLEQLQSVEARGIEAVREIGRLTGNCCICGRELTAEGSIEDGIGPVCAGRVFGP